ncbi:hypothetical protein [uncultured Desulfovibrio sp.]|uniref:hypothetical protein n=1 Tax=uncultured Desulfovibrio sp. TaxID=167968 RepID=UPI0026177905|nr:hypothetical protein [uncultured Desulfovibrio sp.]
MSLTQAEKTWLERRKNLCSRCARYGSCKIGNKHGFNTETCRFWEAVNPKGEILVRNYFYECAKFEARVSEKLAKPRNELRPKGCSWYETTEDGHLVRKTACPLRHDIDNCPGSAMCLLYHARLSAEEEMDGSK